MPAMREKTGQSASTAPPGREAVEKAKQSLRILEVHAAHHRRIEAAREKIGHDVRAHLKTLGVAAEPGESWPALAAATQIIAALPGSLRTQVLDRLPEQIRVEVVERLYSFHSLGEQGDRTVQKLIGAVARRTLATALIGADPALREAIARNMSRRAATMLDEDVESLIQAGELSSRDVRDAREAVGRALYELYESGEVGR